MQSKLSCHVGLNGNIFCHICTVKGAESLGETAALTNSNNPGTAMTTLFNTVALSDDSDCASVASSMGLGAGQQKCKKKETMSELADHAREFLKSFYAHYLFIQIKLRYNRFPLFVVRQICTECYMQFLSMCAR